MGKSDYINSLIAIYYNMNAIQLQKIAHWFYEKHIRIIPGLIHQWIHFRYNSDIPVVTKIGGVLH